MARAAVLPSAKRIAAPTLRHQSTLPAACSSASVCSSAGSGSLEGAPGASARSSWAVRVLSQRRKTVSKRTSQALKNRSATM